MVEVELWVRVTGPDQKPILLKIGSTTGFSLAPCLKTESNTSMKRANSPTARTETIDETLARWERERSTQCRDHKRERREVLRIARACGWLTVEDITYDSIIDWMTDCEAGPRTIKQNLYRLSSFEDFLVRSGRRPKNISKAIPRPQGGVGDGSYALTWEQAGVLVRKAAVTEAGDSRYEKGRSMFLASIAYLGRRPAELLRIQLRECFEVSDDDLPYIEIPGDKSKNKRRHLIALHPEMVKIVSILRAGRPGHEYLFASKPDHRTFDGDLKRAGIPKTNSRGQPATVTSLRKALATTIQLQAMAEAERQAQQIMGHETPGLTKKHYTDPLLVRYHAICKLPPLLGLGELSGNLKKGLDSGGGLGHDDSMNKAPTETRNNMTPEAAYLVGASGSCRGHVLFGPDLLRSPEPALNGLSAGSKPPRRLELRGDSTTQQPKHRTQTTPGGVSDGSHDDERLRTRSAGQFEVRARRTGHENIPSQERLATTQVRPSVDNSMVGQQQSKPANQVPGLGSVAQGKHPDQVPHDHRRKDGSVSQGQSQDLAILRADLKVARLEAALAREESKGGGR